MPFLRVIPDAHLKPKKHRTPKEILNALRIVRAGHSIRTDDILTPTEIRSLLGK